MQTYICKCGKTFAKSSKADSTGYVLTYFSPQHECYGCPYIVTERNWETKEIVKRECRATLKITYHSFTDIGTADKDYKMCHLYSLDLMFVKRVLNYVNSLEGAENHTHAVPDEWRAADFGHCYNAKGVYGLGIFPLYFQSNKKGTAARREVMDMFFDEHGFRKDMTEENEKKAVLQCINSAKENARNEAIQSRMEKRSMKLDITSMIASPASAGTAVREIQIEMLVPYSNHPFTLYKSERLDDMVQSIKTNGVLSPILVRELNGKYEILAGHNRTNAAKLAGLNAVPAIVKTGLSDEEADMYVIETNTMQRGFKELKISEQAAVVSFRHSKMFDRKKLSEIQKELSAMESDQSEAKSKLAQVGEEYELSKNTIARLIRINKLLAACDKYTVAVDEKILSARAAVELSYIKPAALEAIFKKYKTSIVVDNMWHDGVKVDMKLAELLRTVFNKFDGTIEEAERMLDTVDKCKKLKKRSYKVKTETITKYFDGDESDEYIDDIVDQALKMYFEAEKA